MYKRQHRHDQLPYDADEQPILWLDLFSQRRAEPADLRRTCRQMGREQDLSLIHIYVTIKADSLEELVALKAIANSLQKRVHANYRFVLTLSLIHISLPLFTQPFSSSR